MAHEISGIRRLLIRGASGLAIMAAASLSGSPAAQAADAATTLDELVVTAQKREQSILEVPVAITALGSERLEQIGAKDLESLARSIPGLVVSAAGENEPKFYSLRGIGPEFSTAATVAVYVNDTPITIGTNSPDLKIFDFERLEVLRGPQGTLFGSSSMGGAIRYITPAPSFTDFTGRVKGEVGTTAHAGENYEVQLAMGGPLGGNLAFRASGFYQRESGVYDVVSDATGAVVNADANSVDAWGGQLAVTARMSEAISATASVIYQNVDQHDLSYMHTVRQFGGATFPLKKFQKTQRVDTEKPDRFFLPNLLVKADLGFAELTSSTSYQNQRTHLINDGSYFIQGLFGLPPSLGDRVVTPSDRVRKFTGFVQEARLASSAEGPIEWLVGAYYRKSKLDGFQVFGSNLGSVLGAPASQFLAGGAIETFTDISKVEEAALFGELTWKLTDAFKVTGGLRYSDLQREVFTQEVLAPLLTGGGPQPPAVSPPDSHEKPLTPKFSATYEFGKDGMIYASAAKGFREGGPNPPLFLSPACQAALAQLGISSVPTSYDSDSLWSYEVGAKGQTADRRFRATGALYQIDWKDIQQSIQLGQQCGNSPVANLGQARIRGLETDFSWRPVDGLTFDAAVNYFIEAELTKDRITGTTTDPVTGATRPVIGARAGTRLGSVPKFTLSVGAQYDWTLREGWDAFVHAEVQHVASSRRFVATTTGTNPSLVAGSYEVVSVRFGVTHDDYSLQLFANNLFDKAPIISEGGGFAPGGAVGRAQTTIRPRTVGLSLARTF